MADRVLLVEDDPEIASIVRRFLDKKEFELIWCRSAEEVDELGDLPFDIALLDIMLATASGLDICARLRAARRDCPVIFVSCLDDPDTIVRALEMGGDDYVAKPFDANVLVARVKANLRRAGSFHRDTQLRESYEFEGFRLDSATRSVARVDGRVFHLTPLEFQVLVFLIRNPGKYYSSKELYYNVWGENSYGDTRTVISLVHGLRNKIEVPGAERVNLVTVRGRGYAFLPEGAESSR